VDSDGIIVFPFLGRVRLTGMTPVEASEKIAKLLSKPRKVTVLIKYSSAFWVSVLGDVSRPGKFQITGKPTLLSVLGDAGGPLPDADMGGAILIRDKVKTKINLNEYMKDTGTQMEDPYLYPGDTLLVQKSGWPSASDWAIIASILASGVIIAVELNNR
jgi:polysaccharide export outer membrane protein